MAPLWIIGICFTAGILFRRFKVFPENGAKILSSYIIYVALPALVLFHVHELKWNPSLLFAALMPHWIFALAWLVFKTIGKRLAWHRNTVVCLTLTAGLGNTSFVGLPMIQAFFGSEHMGTGILIDQAGSFLCLSTSGLLYLLLSSEKETLAAGSSERSSDRKKPAATVMRRIISFPPFIALTIALMLYPLEFSQTVKEVLSGIGSTLTPVALVAVGFQIRFRSIAGRIPQLSVGLIFRLILSPLIVFGMALLAFGSQASQAAMALPVAMQVTVFEAAMAPMITAGILCVEYDKDPELAGLMLGLGIPLSFLTLPVVHFLLTG